MPTWDRAEHFCAYSVRVQWTPAEIKKRRIARGLTQQELADALDRSRSIVTDWEAGTKEPGARSIRALENVLGDKRDAATLLAQATFMETIAHLASLHAVLQGEAQELAEELQRQRRPDGPAERYRWRTEDAPTARQGKEPGEGLEAGSGRA